MNIKTLNLIAFGKFQNKTIEISDGLNLVFGANEAGKTTIQHFIEGMFFGFFKPYRKKRSFNDDYYRYKPRYSDRYFGSMIIEDDNGDEIRIERDFLKTRDGVRIYNNVTGEDITSAYPYDPVSKQYLPLGYGDFNAVRYNNTVNVKQMASKSDANLAREVNEQLVRLADDRKGDISAEKILDHIRQEKASIGTKSKLRSNYGKAVHEVEDLKNALSESEKTNELVQLNQRQIRKYKERIDQAREQCQSMQNEADLENIEEQKVLQARLNELQEEIDDIESWLEESKSHGSADRKKFGQMETMESSLSAIEERLTVLNEKLQPLLDAKKEADLQCRQFDDCLAGMTKKEIEQDYFTYCRLTRGFLSPKEVEQEQRFNNQNNNQMVDFSGLKLSWLIIGLVAGLIFVLTALINPGQILSLWPQIFVCFLGFVLCLGSSACFVLKRREVTFYDDDLNETSGISDEDEDAEEQPEFILRKYGMSNENDYFSFIDRCRSLFSEFGNLDRSREKINNEIEEILTEKKRLEEKQEHYQQEIALYLEEAGVDSFEDYSQICETGDEVELLKSKLASDRLLYEELSKRAAISGNASQKTFYLTEEGGDMVKIQEAIEAYQHEMDRLIGENQLMMKNMINPVSIRERIETLQRQIDDYALAYQACDLAEKFFSSYFRHVHLEQAPDLNLKIGRLLENITHKYNEVYVDEHMDIRVVDPESGNLISIEQLSGGTVDQIYLSLRFGVADIFDHHQNMPLLLDDPFVQYDDSRKAEAVHLLSDISRTKQVILFTCTADEKRIMDENHYPYIGIGI